MTFWRRFVSAWLQVLKSVSCVLQHVPLQQCVSSQQSSTGSLESLNLERKRPSLVGADLLPPGPPTPDLLTVEPSPQIPGLVTMCFRHLETNGMHTLGIFRVSSSKKRVRQVGQARPPQGRTGRLRD